MVTSKRNQIEGLEAQRIRNCLTHIRARMYRQSLLQTGTAAILYGLLLLAILFLLNRVILLPMQLSTISWIFMSVAVGVGVSFSLKHRKDLQFVARAVDEKMGLSERLGTAFELIQTAPKGEFARCQVQDAASVVETLKGTEIAPYRLPRRLYLFPIPLLLMGLSFAVPPFYEVPHPLTEPQQQVLVQTIQTLEEGQVKNPVLQQKISDTVDKLKAATVLDTAQEHLSRLKKEVRKQQSEQTAIAEATAASQHFRGMDANQLAEELRALTEQAEIPPELQAELTRLFERLAESLPKGGLHDSLNQVQGKAVAPKTLQDIIDALEQAEKSTNLAQLEARLTASQKALALATLETETLGGGIANSDNAPGQNAGTGEVQGTQEVASNAKAPSESQPSDTEKIGGGTAGEAEILPQTGNGTPALQIEGQQITLTAESASDSERFSNVFTGAVRDDAPPYLPFTEVVLNAERAYAEAVKTNRIPVRYQAQIKAYLEAISKRNEK